MLFCTGCLTSFHTSTYLWRVLRDESANATSEFLVVQLPRYNAKRFRKDRFKSDYDGTLFTNNLVPCSTAILLCARLLELRAVTWRKVLF